MLAPRASSAFVCLRCELKLARPRTSAHPRPPSSANFSSSARRHDAADEAQTLPPSEPPAKEDAAKRSLRISKEYIRKGKIVRQRKAKLGMRRMDEDADVLVLNTASVHEEREKTEPEVIEPISVPDILSSLQQDSAPATQEDVEKQLESLRPTRGNPDEPQYITTVDFVKLVAALTRGFTTPQLKGYYSTATKTKKSKVIKLLEQATQATKRSNWHPTTTDIKTRLPGVEPSVGKHAKPRSLRKATLVDKILRDVWKLELLEELEASGELEIRFSQWQLKILQTGGMYYASKIGACTDRTQVTTALLLGSLESEMPKLRYTGPPKFFVSRQTRTPLSTLRMISRQPSKRHAQKWSRSIVGDHSSMRPGWPPTEVSLLPFPTILCLL